MPKSELIVDVHCHMFNGADLPLQGFIEHVAMHDGWYAPGIAAVAAKIVGNAPGFDTDQQRLQGLLEGGVEAAVAGEVGLAELDQASDQAANDLAPSDYATITAALASLDGNDAAEAAGGEEALAASVVRFVRWATLFRKSRIELVGLYHAYFAKRVALAVPMLVDLAAGLSDTPKTTLEQQIVLFDLASQATMLRLLPAADGLAIHPFVGFDPLRVLDGYVAADGRSALQVVKDAVLHHGFIGVKVYPEMGWRAAGNTAANAGTGERAAKLNKILDEFFGWCAENAVPVTAHCNHSNYSNAAWRDAGYGSPDEWRRVLTAHPTLHLNLGHFGGAHSEPTQYTWARTIADLMGEFDHLHTDISCQRVDNNELMNVHFDVLKDMATQTNMLDRLMFGTDWYMEAVNPKSRQFLNLYEEKFSAAFGDTATTAFLGRTALRFLGLTDGAFTKNGERLRRRYADINVTAPGWLGNTATPMTATP